MTIIQSISRISTILLSAIIAFSCAGQMSPSGGPPDTTPPVIVETYPQAGALHFHDNKFSFSFNKYIVRRTLQESFFVSPPIGNLSFEWDGKDVEVSFTDSLKNNTTYILTLGTDILDTRNNRLAKAFTLPFSTGEKIDSCSISGSVFDDKSEGVMVFAYQTDSLLADTLNPSKIKPAYLTQTGKDGSFVMPYLAFGTYRVFAVRDQYKNLLYDPQVDGFGLFTNDLVLTPANPVRNDIKFRMTVEDTVRPFLSSARSLDNTHVLLKLSESIDPAGLSMRSVNVIDTLSRSFLKVLDLSFSEGSDKEAQLVTEHQEIARTYCVTLIGWKDVRGNEMRTPASSVFTAGMSSDTTKPKIEFADLKNSSKNVLPEDSIHLVFSEAILKESFEHGFHLLDSLNAGMKGKFEWDGSANVFFIPAQLFSVGMSYTLQIQMDSVVDFSGNAYKDSILKYQFQVVDERLLSGMSGTVSDGDASAKGKINIIVRNISKKEIKPRTQVLDGPGKFIFENLLEGKYIITAFRDADSNGVYSFGKPYPFKPAERFTVYPDTLKLRARWPLEGVTVRFK